MMTSHFARFWIPSLSSLYKYCFKYSVDMLAYRRRHRLVLRFCVIEQCAQVAVSSVGDGHLALLHLELLADEETELKRPVTYDEIRKQREDHLIHLTPLPFAPCRRYSVSTPCWRPPRETTACSSGMTRSNTWRKLRRKYINSQILILGLNTYSHQCRHFWTRQRQMGCCRHLQFNIISLWN